MKAIAYRFLLTIYALLPAPLQFKARSIYHKFRPRVYQKLNPDSSKVSAASLWSDFIKQNQFERIKLQFDADYYSARYGVELEVAWRHYLDEGIPQGFYTSAKHELNCNEPGMTSRVKNTDLSYSLHGGHETPLLVSASEIHSLQDADLVTIDLWDTLIKRNRPADAAKLATARRILQIGWHQGILDDETAWQIFQERVATELAIARSRDSQEYEISEVLTALLVKLNFTDPVDELVEMLVDCEVAEEVLWSEPVQEVVEVVKKLNSKKVIASDFYMNSRELNVIVANVVRGLEIEGVKTSCELQASKRLDGDMFKALRSSYNVSAEKHLHLGDNLHSDVANQIKSGGRAIHIYAGEAVYEGPGDFSPKSIPTSFDSLEALLSATDSEMESESFKAGKKSALFAVALVMGAIEEALRRNLNVVHYISREGYFLKQIHDQISPLISHNIEITSRHLTVSRRATFGPSLDVTSAESLLEDLARLWSMYSNQSVEALLVSIGLDASSYRESLIGFNLVLQERVVDLGNDERFLLWVKSPSVISRIQNELNENKLALKQYLNESLNTSAGSAVVADIGWRGTIQDNIGRIFPDVQFHGVYLGLFPFLNEQLSSSSKKAVVFDGNKREKYFYAEPPAAIERPWTPHIPSVVKFSLDANGMAIPITEIEKGEVSQDVIDFQLGSISASKLVASWMVAHGYTTFDLRNVLQSKLENYYTDPSSAVAGIWFDSSHDDSFGALNQTSFLKLRPDRTWIENPDNEFLKAAQVGSQWPQGYMAWKPVRSLLFLIPSLKDVG